VEEPTRIIPLSSERPAQQPSNIVRMQPDPGLIKLDTVAGRETLSGGEPDSAQRFSSEVKYVSYFAKRLAETLGMRQLALGIVEDREGQTSFRASSTGWHGAVSSNRRSLWQVRETLQRS